MAKSVVLLSGGLDATVNLARAVSESEVDTVLYFDFGQLASRKELSAVRKIVAKYGVKSRVISLPWLETVTKTALVDADVALPEPLSYAALDTPEPDSYISEFTRVTWVPNRLGLFVNIGASFAEARECEYIVMGLNNQRGAVSPDHSAPFYQGINDALQHSTLNGPQVVSYTGHMTKTEIFVHGREIRAPIELIWDCYRGDPKMCARCESCMRLLRAAEESGNDEWFRGLRLMRERSGQGV